MVRSTVGSRWQVLYGTVRYLSRWPVLSPLLLMMRVIIGQCGELSNASTVPYRTVAVSRYEYYCRTCYSYTLVSHSFRDKD